MRLTKLAMGILVLLVGLAVAQNNIELKGQVSGWLEKKSAEEHGLGLAFHYLPELYYSSPLKTFCTADVQLAANIYNTNQFIFNGKGGTYTTVKPYRAWLRLAGGQWELRLGLQKINFGPARLLRSLKWFDRLDPRDPLQIADGVYALTGRYFFLNNANLWFWGLYGNAEAKGLELFATRKKSVEWGGRGQFPLPRGEMGLTVHHRQIAQTSPQNGSMPDVENRIALDGAWDLGVGLWFEAVVVKTDLLTATTIWQKWLTLGADYTFDRGNGWHVTAEHLRANRVESFSSWQHSADVSAVFSEYPVNIVDALTAGLFYSWNTGDWFRYISWRRTYDTWLMDFSAFWNPERSELFGAQYSGFGGKGLRLLLAYNY